MSTLSICLTRDLRPQPSAAQQVDLVPSWKGLVNSTWQYIGRRSRSVRSISHLALFIAAVRSDTNPAPIPVAFTTSHPAFQRFLARSTSVWYKLECFTPTHSRLSTTQTQYYNVSGRVYLYTLLSIWRQHCLSSNCILPRSIGTTHLALFGEDIYLRDYR